MQTTTRNDRHDIRDWAATLVLGLLMAACIAVVAEPEASWMGFALAALYRAGGARRSCAARVASNR